MPLEFWCTKKDCKGYIACEHRRGPDDACIWAYEAKFYEPKHRWPKNTEPPRRWLADDGTVVYRCYADYCD